MTLTRIFIKKEVDYPRKKKKKKKKNKKKKNKNMTEVIQAVLMGTLIAKSPTSLCQLGNNVNFRLLSEISQILSHFLLVLL